MTERQKMILRVADAVYADHKLESIRDILRMIEESAGATHEEVSAALNARTDKKEFGK